MSSVKDNIIKATTELIEENKGDLKSVTARAIAEKCGIALGLINYHFKSKEKLIEICVQRIVNKILLCFYTGGVAASNDISRLSEQTKQIMDFFFENKAIARVFILSDLKDYRTGSNSIAVQNGFRLAIKGKIGNREKKILAFILTSAMETALLSEGCSEELLGFDMNDKEQRDYFIEDTVNMLFQGVM